MRHNNNNGSRRMKNRGSSNGSSNNSSNGPRRNSNVPPRMQVFDSNGPDVRIRGTAWQVHEKYQALAKDAASSGDVVMAENYLQHAEHYQRIINTFAEQMGSSWTPPASNTDQAIDTAEGEVEMEVEATGQKAAAAAAAAAPRPNRDDDLGLPSSLFKAGSSDEKALESA